jgi:hypothetical protein
MTEGTDTVFENVYNFLRLCHLLFQSSFSPQEESGQKRQKKCIGSEMSEKSIQKCTKNPTVHTI